ncbi:MAG: fused MFS/spermidine synthase [Candidatus Thiodiazotropha weberae]|nr:fused MFS/spermidine synthase [Candidatus Thiodiazotropha weberae]
MPDSSTDSAAVLKSAGIASGTLAFGSTAIPLLYLLVLLSGFAGLGYQIAWTRMLSVSLGHEFTAVLAVVTAFFIGLSLGGLIFNRVLRQTRYPLRWYVALEITIGLWALCLMLLLPHYNPWSAHLIGSEPHPLWHWSVAFGASLLVLLPATLAMGATLPAAHRVSVSLSVVNRGIAGLYAANTGGALFGTLIATYWLLPALGLNHTLLLFASINLAIAALLWLRMPKRQVQPISWPDAATPGRRLLLVLFLTGLLGLGYEILVVRVLAQVLEGTVYSYAAVLAVYLLGTTLGAALYHRYSRRSGDAGERWSATGQRLLVAVSFLCLTGTLLLWATESIYQAVFGQLGPGNLAAMLAELSVATVVFLLPTLAMGGLFSHLAQQATGPYGLGAALGVNTLGAALAPLLFGVILLPLLGALETLVLLAVGYMILPWLLGSDLSYWRYKLPLVVCACALLLIPGPLRFVSAPSGSEMLAYDEGVIAAVAVIEEPDQSRHLKVNNRFTMGGTASRFSDHRQTHLPLLWHGGAARSALYLGLGTGITFQAAQYYPELQATGVELIPEMLTLMPRFGVDVTGPHWRNPPRVIAADARRFVVAEETQYDVIVAEVFHPSRDGAGSLYTVEHFSAIRQRLATDGLFCQWLPLFQLDLDTLRLITRSYLEVFPNAQLHLAHYSLRQPLLCLLGGEGLNAFSDDWLEQRIHDRGLQRQLIANRLNSDFTLFGGYLAGPEALRRFTADVPLNTDDHPRVIFQAPDFVYGDPQSAAQRLLELVQLTAPHRGTLLDNRSNKGDFGRRLQEYWLARDAFLAAGVGVAPSTDIRKILAQTQHKLLDVVRLSSDFLPAYDPLLKMATAVHRVDPQSAHKLLLELEQANPKLPEARRLRRRLFGGDP